MKRKLIVSVFSFVAALTAVSAFAGDSKPVIREEHKISINGVEELWQLEWAQPPSPACGPEDPAWSTCPWGGYSGDSLCNSTTPETAEFAAGLPFLRALPDN
ncbi:hypothetical protein [Geobacter grbiciae]|uniref:hypothetical protein n=1 Tax=Geobacter grbiciae TaxID=155042 RepID=UPI001C021F71|nr:hypothetical protein [Geobacter grbiciae]MBT1073786.1 hypothetical protein [Geobacter grbiciae]